MCLLHRLNFYLNRTNIALVLFDFKILFFFRLNEGMQTTGDVPCYTVPPLIWYSRERQINLKFQFYGCCFLSKGKQLTFNEVTLNLKIEDEVFASNTLHFFSEIIIHRSVIKKQIRNDKYLSMDERTFSVLLFFVIICSL